MPETKILVGDVRAMLRTLPEGSVHCVVTSPPYYGLRDYGTAKWEGGDPECDHKTGRFERGGLSSKQASNHGSNGDEAARECPKCGARRIDRQIGLEATPEEYIATMVEVFREVRRVLRDDGTLWLNIGDSYGQNQGNGFDTNGDGGLRKKLAASPKVKTGCKPKDLLGIPWQLAFALRADGWYLRSEIIWHKPNPMPESVTDRPTKSHEQIFLLTKSPRYFFDQEAVREAHADNWYDRASTWRNGDAKQQQRGDTYHPYGEAKPFQNPPNPSGRNLRSVWSIATEPYAEAHFATFPKAIPEKCIKAGTSEKGCCAGCGAPWARIVEKERRPTRPGEKTKVNGGTPNWVHVAGDERRDVLSERLSAEVIGNRDPQRHVTESVTKGWEPSCGCNAACVPCTVLDPFAGSCTTLLVAKALGRHGIGCELNPEYAEMGKRRISRGYESGPKNSVLIGQKELF